MIDTIDQPLSRRGSARRGSARRGSALRRAVLGAGGAALLASAIAMASEQRPHRPEFPISVAQAAAKSDERFRAMDSDGSGEISAAELAAAPRPEWGHGSGHHGFARHWDGGHRGPADDDPEATGDRAERHEAFAREMFAALDENGDGQLSPEEFDRKKMHEVRREAFQAHVFERLDEDGSGGLSRAELPDPSRWLLAMDDDGDGMVTEAEARAHRGEMHRGSKSRGPGGGGDDTDQPAAAGDDAAR